MLDVSSEDITDGDLLSALLVLAAPLLVQNLVQVLQQAIDLFWLGRYGGLPVAGVSLAFPAVVLLFALSVFTPFVGTQVVVAQRVGRGNPRAARQGTAAGIVVGVTLGLAVGALAYVLAPSAVELLAAVQRGGEAAAVRGFAVDYLRMVALGLAFVALADTFEAAFVGHGDSRASLYINLVTVGTNVVLDPILIFGLGPSPELGVAGAALALVVASGVGSLAGAAMIVAGRNDGMLTASTRPTRGDLESVVDVGLPSAAQQAARQVARVAMVVVAFAVGGAPGVAAYFVGSRVAAVAVVPAIGLQQAGQSIVGQNLGAEHPARAARATWLGTGVAVGGLAIVGVAQWLVPGPITDLLVPTLDAAARELSEDYLRILAIGYPAIGAAYLLEGGFNGARRTRTSFVATLLQFWAVRLPIALVGASVLDAGVHAVFWAVTLSNLAAAIGVGWYFRREVARGMLDRAAGIASGGGSTTAGPAGDIDVDGAE